MSTFLILLVGFIIGWVGHAAAFVYAVRRAHRRAEENMRALAELASEMVTYVRFDTVDGQILAYNDATGKFLGQHVDRQQLIDMINKADPNQIFVETVNDNVVLLRPSNGAAG